VALASSSFLRFLSRIWIRLLAFNVLLVFLPAAGILYLASYEEELLVSQENAMAQEGRLLAAALAEPGAELTAERARQLMERLNRRSASRLRILDHEGNVLADSARLGPRREPGEGADEALLEPEARENLAYQVGSGLFRTFQRIFRAPGPPASSEREVEATELLRRREIRKALSGEYGAASRPTPGQRSLTLHSALPIFRAEGQEEKTVAGVALVSRSTYRLLQEIYEMRLKLFKIFLASVLAAIILSLLVGATIVRPLRRLRLQAAAIVDRRGRLRGRFLGSKKLDEIGGLSRALESLTGRLEEHIGSMESFAADVAHEFKNPLASIRVAAETAAEIDDKTERRRFLIMIQRQVSRMERLLTSARELTRLDVELEHEERQPVDFSALVAEIIEGFRLRCGESVRFSAQLSEEPVFVLASPERLAQILENLLDNAASHSPSGGTVAIRLAKEEHPTQEEPYAVLTVEDEGPGIPPEDLERIFARFFSYRPNGQKGEHDGLGLSVVKAIAEGYGGNVSAANRSRSDQVSGALFRVELPVT